ncbi:MAG: hypothetical protein ABSG46_10005 [Candidatus Binataceae bacterium]|jgi:hypothetical protein
MLPTLMTGLFLAAIAPSIALAMRVGGTLVSPTGQPVASRDLHFQNCITGDIYLSPTHGDGSFGAQLPPGCYQLRSETGAIVEEPIIVTDSDLALGRLPENSPNYLLRVWQSQSIFPSLLTSPAPSTAFILTRDTTVSLLPPTAVAVPMPSSESEWLKLQSQSVSMNPVATPPPATALGSPNAMSEITAPDLGPIPAHPRDIFTEPSFNPEQPVATPPAGASKPSPYQ